MMLHCGDCLELMRGMAPGSVDLIMTSPPYADARKHTYGGVNPDEYVEWFLPRAEAMQRVLKPSGSFVLNIKEKVVDGERHTYVIELILALRAQGWRWIEEYIWHKTNPAPGKWDHRFRDGWERVLHFSICNEFKMNQDAVMQPTSPFTLKKYANSAHKTEWTKRGSGGTVATRDAPFCGREMSYPDNVLVGPVGNNHQHSAVYPKWLPTFFIKLFTDADDVVLDPFCGSGTTMAAAQSLGRQWIGIDKDQSSIDISRKRLSQTQPALIPA